MQGIYHRFSDGVLRIADERLDLVENAVKLMLISGRNNGVTCKTLC